jgi:glycosyltransferase involved in cell wall biosynthesis
MPQIKRDMGVSRNLMNRIQLYRHKKLAMAKITRQEKMNNKMPLITVGIVVLNREWIFEKMLGSLLSQTYPHDKIFVLVVDGKSKDKTVEIARNILEKSDFKGYDIIVKECNIPEGRNICIERMNGDMMFFWDSDVIMVPSAMQDLVRTIIEKAADIVLAEVVPIFVNTIEDVGIKVNEAASSHPLGSGNLAIVVPSAQMGNTLISSNVLASVRFDPDLTTLEDLDFSVRAREKGFKVLKSKGVQAFDINIWKKGHSDIYIDMPLKSALRGLRKKAKVNVLAGGREVTFTKAMKFFLTYKRYLF